MSAMPAPRAGRRARLSMAEQLADNRQSEPGARAPALVRVPQVVATACHGRCAGVGCVPVHRRLTPAAT